MSEKKASCFSRLIYVTFTALLFSLQSSAGAQSPARLQILNAGINLGWISGIVRTEGVTVANSTEIGTDLANANAAISALIPLIETPPYDTESFVEVAAMIDALSTKIGGMPQEKAVSEVDAIFTKLQSALRVYLSGRTGRLTKGGTCDASTLDVGFYYGQGFTALQRSNVALERQARQSMMRSIHVGMGTAKSLPCSFPEDYLSAPVLSAPAVGTYVASLPVLQTIAGIGSLPAGMPPAPASSILSATPPASPSPGPSTGPVGVSGVGFTGTWTTSWGEMTILQAGKGLTATYTHDKGRIAGTVTGNVLTGTWSEGPSYKPSNDAGDVEFTLSADNQSFEGRYRYGSNGAWRSGWNGKRKK